MFQFLPNAPLGKDLFAGQSQEKIAIVLAEILQQDKFQIIGIDGVWGVGKSNLVKIIETKLRDKKYCEEFFIYDVWGHQEDEQRKSILVELTEFVKSRGHCFIRNKEVWDKRLLKLLGKERIITTTNMPYMSIGFIFALLSIIYTPTVNVFKDSIVDFLGIQKLIWKLVLVMFPIFFIVLIFLYYLVKFWIKKQGFWKSFYLAFQDTFQIYTDQKKEETKVETISENEPSVKEFRGWMRDMDKDLGRNKLIIVFDNFDRLPKKNILAIWSSVHIFFSEDPYTNIKVIIPFDRNHIENAFQDLNGGKQEYANDYINKTFDLVYRVAPPILSDWKNFFRDQWKQAFGEYDESEYFRVEQIYDTYNEKITPREIIVFINEIISIKLLDSSIPARYIALFILHKHKILDDPLKAITLPDFLGGLSYLYNEDANFSKYITALAYQLNPNNALEIVYRKQLKDSLVDKDIETFNSIAQTDVFDKIIPSVFTEIEDFTNPILTLDNLGKDSKVSKPALQAIWDDDIYLKIRKEEIKSFELNESQKVLLLRISTTYKKEYLNNIIKRLSAHKDFKVVKYCDIIDGLAQLVEDGNIELNVFDMLPSKTISTEDFELFVNARKNQYKKYHISCDGKQLDQDLAKRDVEKLPSTDFVKYLIDDFSFVEFEKSLKQNIASNKSNVNNLKNIFAALKIVSKSPIGILLSDADIHTLFSPINKSDDFAYDLFAMRLAYDISGNKYNAGYDSAFSGYLNGENIAEIAEKIANIILYYVSYADLLVNSVSFQDSSLYRAVVESVIKSDDKKKKRTWKKILPVFDKICSKNKINPQILLKDVNERKLQIESNLVKDIPNFYFEEVQKNNSQLEQDSRKLAIEYFNNLNKEQWGVIFNALKGKDAQLILIIKYADWNSFALSALQEHLTTTIKSAEVKDGNELTQIIESIISSGKDLTNTFENVRDEFINDRNITPESFIFFNKWLFELAGLDKKPGDVMRTIFTPTLLDNDECVSLFISKGEAIRSLINIAGESNSADFKQGIIDRIGKENIKRLAEILDINLIQS